MCKKLNIALFVPCSFIFLVIMTGCQSTHRQSDISGSTVQLINAKYFPQNMVGVWQNEKYGWGFMFDTNGYITKMVHTIGRAKLNANQQTEIPLIEGGIGRLGPGIWHVEYDGATRELAVEVLLNNFSYRLSGKEIRGSSRDVFIGVVPESDEEIWQPVWISFPDYYVTTSDHKYVDYELPISPGQEDRGVIEFKKLGLDEYQ